MLFGLTSTLHKLKNSFLKEYLHYINIHGFSILSKCKKLKSKKTLLSCIAIGCIIARPLLAVYK